MCKKTHFLIFTLLVVVFLTSCSSSIQNIQNVHITSPAFMLGNNIEKPIEVSLKGKFNEKEGHFSGSIVFSHEIELENIMFYPGAGLISYEGSMRANLGQIFFIPEDQRYSIEIVDPELYELLTMEKSSGKVAISSPAINAAQAQEVDTLLRKTKQPFENQ